MMKPRHLLAVFMLACISFSCNNNDDDTTQEQDAQQLHRMFSDIETLANSLSCTDASNWTFTAFGSKACGGPEGYIAYSTEIDTRLFLEKIKAYNKAREAFNIKWNIFSDCSIPAQPSGVSCVNGEPVLEY
ncbi:hypothetical protein [Formosa sp. S-31]|uniref:hypothetical protein n=1 Tax=Formosa sp. S-31 TaxID=2790949 RepID=UPI003EC0D531